MTAVTYPRGQTCGNTLGAVAYFDQLAHHELLRLDTADFPARRELPSGYCYVEEVDEEDERRLLEPAFPGSWQRPVGGRLAGMRVDSRVAVGYDGRVVGVCYVTDANQLGIQGYGELHYAAVDDGHRGGGLWGAMITELFARAASWEVSGVIFVTDRTGPIEMYRRLGAQRIGIRPKPVHRPWWWRLLARARRAVSPAARR